MASSAGGRPSGALGVVDSLGWRPLNPSALMMGLPSPVSKTLYKVGLRRRCCHLCFLRDHLVSECPNGSSTERKLANEVYYKFWTFIVADELLSFSLSIGEDDYFRRANVKGRTHYIQPSCIMSHGTAIGQRHPGMNIRRADAQMRDQPQSTSSTESGAPFIGELDAQAGSAQHAPHARPKPQQAHVQVQPAGSTVSFTGRDDGRGGRGWRAGRGGCGRGSGRWAPQQPVIDFNTQWRTPARASKAEKHGRSAALLVSVQSPFVSPPNKVHKTSTQELVPLQSNSGIPREVLEICLSAEDDHPPQPPLPPQPYPQTSSQQLKGRVFAYKDLDKWTLDKFKQAGKDAREYYWQNVGPAAALKMAMALRELPVGHQTRMHAEPHWKRIIAFADEAQKLALIVPPQLIDQPNAGAASSATGSQGSLLLPAQQETATSTASLPIDLVVPSAASAPASDSPPLIPFDDLDGQDAQMQA